MVLYESASGKGYKTEDINFKINVSMQINRISELFSQKIDERHSDITLAQKIRVDTIINAIDALEIMMFPYIDNEYKEGIKKLRNEIKKIEKKDDKINAKLKFAKKKWALLMQLMDKNKMLLERSITLQEGF